MFTTSPHGRRPSRRLSLLTLLLLPALCAPSPSVAASAQNVKDVQTLAPGRAVERALAGGESHSYLIAVGAGQLLHAEVEQRGIDVVVAVSGPDGRPLLEVDSPNGAQGPEPVRLIAAAAGDYRLEVRSLEANAAAGRYEIKIVEVRGADARDRARLSAEQAEREADQIFRQDTPDAARAAIKKMEQALSLWREAGDRAKEVFILTGIGKVYSDLGEHAPARDHLERARTLAQTAGDADAEALALILLSGIDQFLGETESALASSQRALALVRATGNREFEIIALRVVAQLLTNRGERQQALDLLDRALRLSIETQDAAGEAMTLGSLAGVHYDLGDYEKALYYSQRALPFTRRADTRAAQAQALANIGGMQNLLGRRREALASLREALALSRAGTERRVEALVLNNIATLHLMAKEYPRALAAGQQALTLARAIKSREVEALALVHLGQTYTAAGRPAQALEHLELALPIWRALGERGYEAHTLAVAANAERKRGALERGVARVEAALKIAEALRAGVGSPGLRASYLASVQGYYEIYIELLMSLDERRPGDGFAAAALHASERARARSLIELLTEANADIRQGIDPALVARRRSLQQRLDAKAQQQSRLLDAAQQADAGQAESIAAEIESLTAELQQVEGQIRRASPRYAALTQPEPLHAREIQRDLLDEETLLVEYSLGGEHSYLWVVSRDAVTSHRLPKREVIEAAARQFYELSRTEPRQEEAAARGKRGLGGTLRQRGDARLAGAAARLSRLLLAPAAARLGRKRLLVVGDGALQYIPFASLPKPAGAAGAGEPLVVTHEVVNLPSASTLAVLRREAAARKRATRTLAVFADPVFDRADGRIRVRPGTPPAAENVAARTPDAPRGVTSLVSKSASESGLRAAGPGLPRLPGTRREASEIAKLVPPGEAKVALDFDASRAAATAAELSDYRYLHFATHGFLNSRHPELSGLALSMFDAGGAAQDGFLRAHEVFNLRLAAEVVVLSACRTGLGQEVRGEGLVGLTRGFMYAGSPRVVVSLWDVSDEATAELMARFYRGLMAEGLRPAEALRAAQVSLRRDKRFASPFYWAAFTIQGEWR